MNNVDGEELDEDDEESGDDESFAVTASIDEDHLTLATHASPANLQQVILNLSNVVLVTSGHIWSQVIPLLSHWNAAADRGAAEGHPVSVAVYAPGEDFCVATAVISWLWTCDKV